MFRRQTGPVLHTERLLLRLPRNSDYAAWANIRHEGHDFLAPWEPARADDYAARRSFLNRVYWAERSAKAKTAMPFMITKRSTDRLLGALTLDNIRQGASMAATVGYWIGPEFARQGYMREALDAVVHYAFSELDLSRVEAACLPENKASRGLLEQAGFKYEGVAQSYLQIAGRWRTHVLYANLRGDRRGKTSAGQGINAE